MLLLPLVVGDAAKREEIKDTILKNIFQMPLKFKEEDVPVIAEFLVSHLIFEGDEPNMFETDPELGVICKRNHSRRRKDSPSNSPEEIKEINKLIKTAMGD